MTGLPGVVSHSPRPSPPSAEHLPTFKPIPSTITHDEQHHSIANVAAPLPPSPASKGGGGGCPSLLITAAIILFVFVASAFIHLLLRFLSRHSSTPSSPSAPLVLLRRLSSSASAAAPEHTPPSPSSPSANRPLSVDEEALIDSLPLFAASSSLVDGDCAVCLSRFHPHDLLRLLPSCCHAFHATCIDTWLRSTLSCPLCRSPLLWDPFPPLPVAVPPPPATTAPHTTTIAAVPRAGSGGSGSYSVEIGSVSRRSDAPSAPPLQHARSYSLGSSFDYVVEGEVEAVVSAPAAHVRREGQEDHKKDASVADPAPPGEDVAAAAGEGEGSRNWVRDYVNRVTSSASSSSSLRFSRWGSRRAESGVSWDLEGNYGEAGEDEEESVDAYYAFFHRWLTGGA